MRDLTVLSLHLDFKAGKEIEVRDFSQHPVKKMKIKVILLDSVSNRSKFARFTIKIQKGYPFIRNVDKFD
jgi:hypothetical protein